MKRKTYVMLSFLAISIICFVSCTDGENSWGSNEDFEVDTIVVLNYFDDADFEKELFQKLLLEIGLCSMTPTPQFGPDTLMKPFCSPKNYKFFKYNSSMSWNDGFGLEIRATVDDFPLRRFILFERVDSKLIKMRGFVANLSELHSTPSGYYDLMLLFPDREAGSFVVKFVWNNEDLNYEYASLEAIDGYPVKKERQDSLSNVVLQRLTENNMFF